MKTDAQAIARRPVISALGVICAVQFVLQLDFSIVNVALPTIQRELGFVPADLQWVVTGYALTFGSLLAVALGSLVGLYVGSVIAGHRLHAGVLCRLPQPGAAGSPRQARRTD